MTSVRVTRRHSYLLILCLPALAAFTGSLTPRVQAQGGAYSYGRELFGGPQSGAATGVADINRRGFGMTFRGGHTAGDTVGRQDSVSHISLVPYINIEDGLFFGDSRINYSNDGNLAWSFGGGYRQYIQSWDAVLGGYGYFDRDKLTGAYFKQWSVGAELLAHRWEVRGNYYEPFGTDSALTGSRFDATSTRFVGNNIEFTRVDTFAEALKGFDAEVGVLLPGQFSERFDVRGFAGTYRFQGPNIDGFFGWSTRLQADINDWLELGLKLTDDEVTHTNVAFTAAVHFGGFRSQEHTSRSAIQRLADPVRRSLNVVASTSDVALPGQIALDPADGLPFNVVHVNSNDGVGPFLGTVEDPFNSLMAGLAAPGADIVFVHADSVFNAPPENTVLLAPDQDLFGEGLIASPTGDRLVVNTIELAGLGELPLPASPTFEATGLLGSRPIIQDSPGDAVTLNTNSRFGGFIIQDPIGHGVTSSGVGGTLVRDTLITGAGGDGIFLQNTVDTTSFIDTIVLNAVGPAFHVDGGNGQIGFTATSTNIDPAFGAINNSSQEAVLIENMTGGFVNMSGSTIDDVGGAGIVIRDSASSATIDNATITDSTGTGIAITNSTGIYTFRNSVRNATTINNPADTAVLVNGLGGTGRVTFADLSITQPQAGALNLTNLSGQVLFTQPVTIGVPNGGAADAVSVTSMTDTGSVQFNQNLVIDGSNGAGIVLSNNAAGSTFIATRPVEIGNPPPAATVAGPGLSITNDAGSVQFADGITVGQRLSNGIFIDNASGIYTFQQGNTVNNELGSLASAVSITNSTGLVNFDSLAVTNAFGPVVGGAGIHLQDNPGRMIFSDIDVTSVNGVGVFGLNNSEIRITDGMVTTTGAAAIDIENSGIAINLGQVNSAASPDFGIRLVETNQGLLNDFVVGELNPALPIGTGGSIQTAGISGALFQNAGQVSLRLMQFDDNLNGIQVRNSGLAEDDDQFVEFLRSAMTRSDVIGIDAQNLMLLDIRDSTFDDNGDTDQNDDATANPSTYETILLTYDEIVNPNEDTIRFSQFENPYTVNIQRTSFIDNSDDLIRIINLAGANDAHLDVNLDNNTFIINDANDFDNNDLNESVFQMSWDGPNRVRIASNRFEMNGTNTGETQIGIDILARSLTDEHLLEVVGNNLLATSPTAVGLDLETRSFSTSLISANEFDFQALEGTGMTFRLAGDTDMTLTTNLLRFGQDGGAGMIFNSVSQPAFFFISGNQIGMFDAQGAGVVGGIEEGIRFRAVTGTVSLAGPLNNQVFLLNPFPPAFIEVPFEFNGIANGQILVNGQLVP